MHKQIIPILLIFSFLYSCESYNLERNNLWDSLGKNYKPELATLTTEDITEITENSGTSGGIIISDGYAPVTARGVCWSTSINPKVDLDTKTFNGTGPGAFISQISGLSSNTTYYIRSYATNIIGTSYGSQVIFRTPIGSIKDVENNVYNIVSIGTQTWMAENLKTTKYSDGTSIPNLTDNQNWLGQSTRGVTSGAYCDYNNNPINSNTYGRLYNWYAVDNNSSTSVASNGGRNVCPTGWHVPTDAEWTTLITYLDGEFYAGGKLKEAGSGHWYSNFGATNEAGFTALPGGDLGHSGSVFYGLNYIGNWWSSSGEDNARAWFRVITNGTSDVKRFTSYKQSGFSIRCVKD